MAFELAAVAGLVTGLTFDLFVLCALIIFMFPFVVIASAKAGFLAALASAIALVGALQVGYMLGFAIRALWPARLRARPARSAKNRDR